MTMYQLSLDLETPAENISAAAANPFLDARVRTFADMIALVRHDSTLPARRRYELASALSGLARLMRQELAAMPAMASAYRRQLTKLTPTGCGLSTKRLANIKSDVMFCLRRYGATRRRTAMPPVGRAWQPIWQRLDRYQSWALSRFVRWCSASGRIPQSITDSDITQFYQAIAESFKTNPARLTQAVCRTWNKLRVATPEFDLPALTVPRYHQAYCLPESSFPASFRRELHEFCKHLALDDLFDEDAPPRPLRPESIKLRRFHVRQLASGLVHKDKPIETIKNFAVLVEPDNLASSLRFFIDRAGGKPTAQIAGLAGTAKLVARHWVRVDPSSMDRIKRITAKVRFNQAGMTKKNRDRLRQFDIPENRRRLLFFSEMCFAELRHADDGGIPAARLAQAAIAVEFLLTVPIRLANLASLRLDVHILTSRTTEHGVWHLVIPREETKNKRHIEAVLPAQLVATMQEYLGCYRPRLASSGNDFLFPSATGQMQATTLGKVLSTKLLARTGLQVNPHLFRHLAGKLILEDMPGHYGIAQTVLGHHSPKTTLKFYTGEETRAAFRHYENVVAQARARLGIPGISF
jgi:integrase